MRRGRPALNKPTATFSIRIDQELYDVVKMRRSEVASLVRSLLQDYARKHPELSLLSDGDRLQNSDAI